MTWCELWWLAYIKYGSAQWVTGSVWIKACFSALTHAWNDKDCRWYSSRPCARPMWDFVVVKRRRVQLTCHSLNFTAAGEFYNELCTQSLSLSVLLCVSLLLQVESFIQVPSVLNPPHSCDSEILLHRSSCWLLALWALQCSESKRHTFVKRTLQWFLKWP